MDNNYGENKLNNITISNVSMDNVTIDGSLSVNASTMINGSVFLGNNDILSISEDSMVIIDGNQYSGREIGDIFKILSKFKEVYPQFII